ncbi:hypothetical protein [uncultured Gemmiger sp.]|uniref:hypothetical protein n=1 Tax=uncultured Gemmiger sp. TaxID=1623490 RepID=UPI0025F48DDF|nr:hypothetical protein [uncultured Gemmiger sp.]
MLQRRPSSIATMLGIVVLVAVVLVLLMQPGRTPVQPADFTALSADASYTAKSSSTGDGFTLTVNLDDPASAAGQTVYQGSYGSIVLEAVTDVSETGCTLQFASSGGQDADGKACLVSGALPGEEGLMTAEISLSPAGWHAEFGTEAAFTSTGNTFSLHMTEGNSADAATPENASRQVTLTLRNLPQIVFTAKK